MSVEQRSVGGRGWIRGRRGMKEKVRERGEEEQEVEKEKE